ncbi:MAG: hypothetical protein ACRC5M_00710 [Anaeroplasmataceae bacterium]
MESMNGGDILRFIAILTVLYRIGKLEKYVDDLKKRIAELEDTKTIKIHKI